MGHNVLRGRLLHSEPRSPGCMRWQLAPAWTFSHLGVDLDPRQRQSVDVVIVNSLRQTNDVAGLLCLAFVQIIAKGLHPESLRRVNLSEAWWHAFVLVKASATMMDLDPVCWT